MRSFINFMLPKDEYQRLKVLYFIAEAAVIVMITMTIISLLDIFLFDWILWLAWILPWLMALYVFFRYAFAGLEYSDMSKEQQYKNRKRKSLKTATATAILFYLLSLTISGGFTNKAIALDKLGLAITFFIFFYAFDRFSLARSYRKNKDIDDE